MIKLIPKQIMLTTIIILSYNSLILAFKSESQYKRYKETIHHLILQ